MTEKDADDAPDATAAPETEAETEAEAGGPEVTSDEGPPPKKSKKKRAEAEAEATSPPSTPRLTPRSPKAIAIAVVAMLSLFALDLYTKHLAEEALSTARVGDPPAVCEAGPSGYAPYQRLRGDSVVLIDGMLELEYAENCGSAFSLFADMPAPVRHAIFYVAALLAVIVLSTMFYQGKGGRYFEVAVPMVIAGALGNFHDRFRFGYVVDFIHAHWESVGFDYPVFNVADCAVVIGVIALVVDSYVTERTAKPAPGTPTGSAKPA